MSEFFLIDPPTSSEDGAPCPVASVRDGSWELVQAMGDGCSLQLVEVLVTHTLPALDAPLDRYRNQDDLRALPAEDREVRSIPTASIRGMFTDHAGLRVLRDQHRREAGVARQVRNTTATTSCDWPDGIFIQGGEHGIVVSPKGNYATAFVEVSSEEAGFIRGEGATVAEAESRAWDRYRAAVSCPGHEWESRGYRNGAGFCRHCGRFATGVFDLAEVGHSCAGCGRGCYYHQDESGQWWCEACAPSQYRHQCPHGNRFAYWFEAEDCDCDGGQAERLRSGLQELVHELAGRDNADDQTDRGEPR